MYVFVYTPALFFNSLFNFCLEVFDFFFYKARSISKVHLGTGHVTPYELSSGPEMGDLPSSSREDDFYRGL